MHMHKCWSGSYWKDAMNKSGAGKIIIMTQSEECYMFDRKQNIAV